MAEALAAAALRRKLRKLSVFVARSVISRTDAIEIASVLIVSRVNLQKWLRDKKSYVYVVAM